MFFRRHNIVYNFLSRKSELSFTKDPNTGHVRVHLEDPSSWKEITFDTKDNTMKVEDKEKTFDVGNDTTWKRLEGKYL